MSIWATAALSYAAALIALVLLLSHRERDAAQQAESDREQIAWLSAWAARRFRSEHHRSVRS